MTLQPSRSESDTPDDLLVEPATWPDGCLALLHELWGDAKVAKPYDRQQKRKFARLLAGLEQLQVRTGHLPHAVPPTVQSRRE